MIWNESRVIPRGPAAVLGALRFSDPAPLPPLGEDEWAATLAFSDRAQITLLLGRLGGLPERPRQRIERNLCDNARHFERVEACYFEIAEALEAARLEHVMLKGFARAPLFVPALRFRVQYDIDLLSSLKHLLPARDAILALGYQPVGGGERLPVDHLPTMLRSNGWRWNGNYFDPDLPVAIDLHFRLWDAGTERFEAPGVERFWDRRTQTGRSEACPAGIPVLDEADSLGYAALHALRHWLRGSLKVLHIYELAYFLETRAEDDEFWRGWRAAHDPGLRRLEALSLRLAIEWFGCREPEAVREEIERLPKRVGTWLEESAASPVEAMFTPRKDELWLHLALVNSLAGKASVLRRRLAPARLPAGQVGERAAYHARALAPTLWRGLKAWRKNGDSHYAVHAPETLGTAATVTVFHGLGRPFWTFLGAATLFNFGLFVFFLLYNLHLLDLGYREGFLGLVAGAMMAGNIAGALPAGALIERLHLRRALAVCFTGVTAISVARALVTGETALVALAFLGGVAASLWAVSIPPVVARLTDERTRPRGFSVVFAAGIATGVLGGLVGGRLPEWFAPGALSSKQAALLAGCGVMALALVPISRLRLASGAEPRARTVYPRSPFVVRFLAVIALWSAAVAAFNPFFNAYFSRRLHASTSQIGAVFSISQLAQVAAVLLAPLALRKLGAARGILAMQLATAAALAVLAGGPAGWAAVLAYASYMSFQYMSEPGIYSLLMGNVGEREQSGASSLNFLVISSSQALAATLAGAGYARFGYPAVLAAAAALAFTAAALFRLLVLGRRQKTIVCPTG